MNLVFGGASFTEAQKALAKIDGVCGVEKAAETEKIKGERKLCGLRVLLKEGVEARKEIFSAAVANKWTIYHMEIQKNSLEDVFHTLTQGKDEK